MHIMVHKMHRKTGGPQVSDWIPSETHPGYIEKSITNGPAAIVIYRPILSEAEAARTQSNARAALESALRERYIARP